MATGEWMGGWSMQIDGGLLYRGWDFRLKAKLNELESWLYHFTRCVTLGEYK